MRAFCSLCQVWWVSWVPRDIVPPGRTSSFLDDSNCRWSKWDYSPDTTLSCNTLSNIWSVWDVYPYAPLPITEYGGESVVDMCSCWCSRMYRWHLQRTDMVRLQSFSFPLVRNVTEVEKSETLAHLVLTAPAFLYLTRHIAQNWDSLADILT